MLHVSRSGGRRGNLRKIGRWGRTLLQTLGRKDAELSVVIGDDAFIAELNQQWRAKDGPTDVLSFPQDGADGPLLGDVVISVETAARQAADQGHDLDTELQVLLVHGLCHLLGHDHHDLEETAAMRRAERELLEALRVGGTGLVERVSSAE